MAKAAHVHAQCTYTYCYCVVLFQFYIPRQVQCIYMYLRRTIFGGLSLGNITFPVSSLLGTTKPIFHGFRTSP